MLNSRCQSECLETSIRDAAFRSFLSSLSNAARWGRAAARWQLATCSLCPRPAPAPAPRCPHLWEHPPPPALPRLPWAGVPAGTGLQAPVTPVGPWHRTGLQRRRKNNARAGACSRRGKGLAAPPGAGREAGAGALSRWTLLPRSGEAAAAWPGFRCCCVRL